MNTVASIFILISFISVIGLFLASSYEKKVFLIFGVWGALIGFLAYSGFYLNVESMPPRIITVLIPSFLIVFYFYKSVDLKSLKLGWLIAIHLVRIPVELILHNLYLEGYIPKLMTYEGWNFDILSGVSAIVILALHYSGSLNSKVLKIWNWCTLILLVAIVSMAILSAPSPIQLLAFEQPNTAILRFPFTLLPAVIVPIVLLSHLFIFQLLYQRKTSF